MVGAQEEDSEPVASIITNESEATSVLGGGWPPQRFGKTPGVKAAKNLWKETKEKVVKISNSASQSAAQNSTKKKVNPDLVAQSAPSGSSRKILQAASPPPEKPLSNPAPVSRRTNEKIPSFQLPVIPKKEIKNQPSTTLKVGPGSTPLVLPPLPDVVDSIVPPTLTPARPRPPRSSRPKVRSLYTLGAGDTVSFSSFDRADLARTVKIAPDGTVSYLQAVAVDASGLTVDELRERMESELRKYRRDFKLIVSPQEMQSKEFAILGRVRSPGSFPLDRPTTVLEGIALAEGVEIGTIRGSAFGLADFGRSFVSRKGRKLDVDFTKLYYEGDFDQNVYLQPDDYLYIASVLENEYYILGAVNAPGRIKMPNEVTVTQAISLGGGFLDEAYKMKVVVIRGDLNCPEVHVMNIRDVVRGAARDMVVENRDIIFVARRPFEIVERVIDSAITTYMQTVTAEAINLNFTN